MTNDELASLRLLLLPGWLNSDGAHWQSRWEVMHGARRVEQDDWLWPKRGDWMTRLDEVLLESDQPAVLIAHSLGCQLVASWAAHSRLIDRVRAALLVATPDPERADMPPNLFNWRDIVRQSLPFRSLLVISRDDPFCAPERAEQMARDWGAAVFDIGACGHVNGASSLADWPQGWALMKSLCADR